MLSSRQATTQRITLDVGGVCFTTTITTLTRIPNTYFDARLKFESHKDVCEKMFIDRCGKHFAHILEFLRTGTVHIPNDHSCLLAELIQEAVFYSIAPLIDRLRGCYRISYGDALIEEDRVALKAEGLLRLQLAEKRSAYNWAGGLERCSVLVSLFDGVRGQGSVIARLATGVECDIPIADLEYAFLTLPGSPAFTGKKKVVANYELFTHQFNFNFPNILSRLARVRLPCFIGWSQQELESPTPRMSWMVAGGSTLRCLLDPAESPAGFPGTSTSDIDIFFFGPDDNHATAKILAKNIYDELAVNGEHWAINRTSKVINLFRFNNPRWYRQTADVHVQIILHIFRSPAEILTGFDVDCCAFGFDGQQVYALPRAIRALECGYNIANPLHSWPNRATYELRLVKYACRGFAVALPGIQESQFKRSIDDAKHVEFDAAAKRLESTTHDIDGGESKQPVSGTDERVEGRGLHARVHLDPKAETTAHGDTSASTALPEPTRNALYGLDRLLILRDACSSILAGRKLSLVHTMRSMSEQDPCPNLSFDDIISHLRSSSLAKQLQIDFDYSIAIHADVDGGSTPAFNESLNSCKLQHFAGWDMVDPSSEILHFIRFGDDAEMTNERREASWTKVANAPAIPTVPRLTKPLASHISPFLMFDVGPRMREYLNSRLGTAHEDAWFHAGLRDDIKVRAYRATAVPCTRIV